MYLIILTLAFVYGLNQHVPAIEVFVCRFSNQRARVGPGSGGVTTAAVDTVADDLAASSTLNEVLLGQEVEETGAQSEALGNEEGTYCTQSGQMGNTWIIAHRRFNTITGSGVVLHTYFIYSNE